MNILVFGFNGQVARELRQLAKEQTFSFVFLDRKDANLSFPNRCSEAILTHKPNAVINAAAWTDVDGAEIAEAEATVINGEAPGSMATACARLSIPFLHISSDYVFDGSGNLPWRPNDPTQPLSAYGRSKLLGEQLVQKSGAQAIILRTSWVFSAHGSNFVKTMLRLGSEKEMLNVVGDQVGGPTSAQAIASAMIHLTKLMVEGCDGGTLHFSGTPDVSWAEFAREIMELAGLSCEINPILTKDYPTTAPRPLNSRMDDNLLYEDYGIIRPAWSPDLEQIIIELRELSGAT